ncbi:hypothetical protein B0H21DRAFT_520610 [Amylocystis lapponica]|nr:hypothetical protein B0H21DRAFT_520610 [Amylocystis lapponica]
MSPAEQSSDLQLRVPGRTHRVFSIPEILMEIFQWLSPSRLSWTAASKIRLTLYRAAFVCTAFRDPALDILWRELGSLMPLLKIVKLYRNRKLYNRRVRPPIVPFTPYGWSRFLLYSSRIHTLSLGIDYSNEDEVSINSLTTELNSRAQGEPAFPSMEALFWGQPELKSLPESLVIAALSHPPTLRCFNMDLEPSHVVTSDVLGTMLHKLRNTVPMLQELSFEGFSDVPVREHYGLLAGLQALRVLECRVVSLPMLRFCADLGNLAVFRVDLTTFPSKDYQHVCLRTVCTLKVRASMDTILRFLETMTYPLLTSLEIDITQNPEKKRLAPRFKELSMMFAPNQALRTLWINLHMYTSLDDLVNVVAPLLELHQLEDVTIKSYDVILDDNGLHDLASSWPNLRTLAISGWANDMNREPHIQALAVFAHFCPKLHWLELPSLEVPLDPGPVPAVCHSLRYLIFDFRIYSMTRRCPRPVQVARFLHEMFPNVACLEDDEDDENDGLRTDYWKEVNEVWTALRAGRDLKEPEGVLYYSHTEFVTLNALR